MQLDGIVYIIHQSTGAVRIHYTVKFVQLGQVTVVW